MSQINMLTYRKCKQWEDDFLSKGHLSPRCTMKSLMVVRPFCVDLLSAPLVQARIKEMRLISNVTVEH